MLCLLYLTDQKRLSFILAEARELKKATAVLLQNMLERILHLEKQVEKVIMNSTAKFNRLHRQIEALNSSMTHASNSTKGETLLQIVTVYL